MLIRRAVRRLARSNPVIMRLVRSARELHALTGPADRGATASYVRTIRRLGALVRSRKLSGGAMTAAGEFYLRLPDGLHLYYNVDDPSSTPGDGQSLELAAAQAQSALERFVILAAGTGHAYLDVGANNGAFYALKVAAAHPGVRVHAFEPDPWILPHLRRNVAFNGLEDRITIAPVAVADHEGTARLTFGLGASGYVARSGAGIETVEVPCTSLDRYSEEHDVRDIAVVKVDVEGGELAVLQGARTILDRDHPLLILEFDASLLRRSGAEPAVLLELLRSHGYECHQVLGQRDILAIHPDGPVAAPGDRTWSRPIPP